MKKNLQITIIMLALVGISFNSYSQSSEGIKVEYYSGNCENGTGTLKAPVSDFKLHGEFKNGLLDGVVFCYGYSVLSAYSSEPDFFVTKIKQTKKGIILFSDFEQNNEGIYFEMGKLMIGDINDLVKGKDFSDFENPRKGVSYYNYKGQTHLDSENTPKEGWIYWNSEKKYGAYYEHSITESGIKKTLIELGTFNNDNELTGIGMSIVYLENDLRLKFAKVGKFKNGKLNGEGAEYMFNGDDYSKIGDFKEGNFENGEYKGAIIDKDF